MNIYKIKAIKNTSNYFIEEIQTPLTKDIIYHLNM